MYKGKELSYSKLGKVKNENQKIAISDGNEWFNFLKYVNAQGYCKIDFISVIEGSKNSPIKDVSIWQQQLKEACNNTIELELPIVEEIKIDEIEPVELEQDKPEKKKPGKKTKTE